jgi:hypothetical protein
MKDSVPTVSSSLDEARHFAPPKTVLQRTITCQRRKQYRVSSTSATMAFVTTPSITLAVINSEVLKEWRALSLSLHEWNKKVFISTNASDEVPTSSAAMEVLQVMKVNLWHGPFLT